MQARICNKTSRIENIVWIPKHDCFYFAPAYKKAALRTRRLSSLDLQASVFLSVAQRAHAAWNHNAPRSDSVPRAVSLDRTAWPEQWKIGAGEKNFTRQLACGLLCQKSKFDFFVRKIRFSCKAISVNSIKFQ